MQEARRQRVADLLSAHVKMQKIASIVGVNLDTVYRIKRRIEAGREVKRLPGSARPSSVLTPDFLASLKAEVTADPHKSMSEAFIRTSCRSFRGRGRAF